MKYKLIWFFSATLTAVIVCFALGSSANTQEPVATNAQSSLPDFDIRNQTPDVTAPAKPRVWALHAPLSQATQATPNATARRFLQTRRDLFQLEQSEVAALTVAREYRTAHNGLTHITLQQRHQGIAVFQGDATTHIARNGEIIAASSSLVPHLAGTINTTKPALTNKQAIRLAGDYAAVPAVLENKYERAVTPELVYFPLTNEQTRLAWQMTLWLRQSPDVYLIVLDAERGSLFYRQNLTNYLQTQINPRGAVFTGESPRPNLPIRNNNPATVEREELPFRPAPFNGRDTFTAGDRHYDWWNGASPTTLVSNNTSTYLDRDSVPNQPDQPRLTAEDGNFTFPLDLSLAPTTSDYQKAAQANVFYWVNRYHDILYQFGFTEAAGNFQTNNFGLGGNGNDAVLAEAQDGSGTNNANFSTPADGSPGRMQMYLWTGNPQRDGDFDQGVIIHELTHGLSNRLVGGGGGALSGLQAGGMGEGWSDYFGIVLLAQESDDLNGNYAVGQYALNNYTRGIRRFPYSTNPTIYPFNYGDVRLTTAVHPTGEIWCNTLLEMRALLIRQYGFQEGQRQSLQLVVDGMKLTPRAPSFVDARNGILLADKVNNNGANQCLLWQAFSKRGLGAAAEAINSADNFPLESFEMPPACNPAGTLTLDRQNYLPGETMRIRLGDRNASGTVRVRVTSSSTSDEETVTLTPDATFVGAFAANLRVNHGAPQRGDGILQAALAASDKISVVYDDADNGAGAPARITAEAAVAGEKSIYEDDVERGNRGWQTSGANNPWGLTSTRVVSGVTAWSDSPAGNTVDNTNSSLISPPFDFSAAAGVTLSFAHAYAFENGFDYAFVEASVDGGATWARLSGYTGTLANFTQARLNLDRLAGLRNVRLRFRVLTDVGTNLDGWYLDDIRLIVRTSDQNELPPVAAYTPVITELLAAFGTPTGGNSVRILGANFTDNTDTRVFFGGLAATNTNIVSNGVITCNVPAAPGGNTGRVNVRVETRYGSAQLINGYLYYRSLATAPAAAVTSVLPDNGSVRGNTTVTLLGNNFTPETRIQFGDQPARSVQFISAQMLRVVTPAAATAGSVNLLVTHGLSLLATIQNGFRYTAPTPPLAEIIAPNGGEQWFIGNTITVRWRSSDNRAVTRHRLELVRGTTKVADIATNLEGAAQSFNWTIPATLAVQSDYRIRVIAVDDEGTETEALPASAFTLARRWQTAPAVTPAVQRSAVTTDGRYLYNFGGRTGTASSSTVATVQRLDLTASNAAWSTVTAMPVGLNAADAAHLNGKIYLPGGINVSVGIEQKLHVYDIASNTWTTAAAPPADLYLYALVADEARNVLYQIGGIEFASGDVSRKVWMYAPQTNQWSEMPALTNARWGHEAALIAGKLYVCGGFSDGGGVTSTEAYDFSAQRWMTLANMNAPRRYAVNGLARSADGRAFWLVAAGENPTGPTPYANAEAYDLAANQWFPLDASFNLSAVRTATAGTAANGFLFAVAGNNSANNVATVERLPLNDLQLVLPNQPPLLVVPDTTTVFTGTESAFTINAYDYSQDAPLMLTASNLPANANFEQTTTGNQAVSGRLRWTPRAEDANRDFPITFTVTDGKLSEIKSLTLRVKTAAPLGVVNAADYRATRIAPDQISAAFGTNLATQTLVADTLPLPTTLGGTSVTVNGLAAPLFFVSPSQINFLMPPQVGLGAANIVVRTVTDVYSLGTAEIVPAMPALFTANATGIGEAAALATTDGVVFQTMPFDVTLNGRANILLLFGTGFRRAAAEHPNDGNGVAEAVTATIDGQAARVLYAGAQGSLVGLDQLNLEIPPNLARGERSVEITLSVNGLATNRVTVRVR
jgi:uncharacterized protein (TIGR03437 family)